MEKYLLPLFEAIAFNEFWWSVCILLWNQFNVLKLIFNSNKNVFMWNNYINPNKSNLDGIFGIVYTQYESHYYTRNNKIFQISTRENIKYSRKFTKKRNKLLKCNARIFLQKEYHNFFEINQCAISKCRIKTLVGRAANWIWLEWFQ